MATQIQLRRDTAANWTSTNPTMAQGEAGYETDTGKLKVGDGTTAWNSLVYQAAANIVDGTIVNADVNASAAIAGTKIAPDFGSQTIATTGVFSHALGAAATPSVTFTGDLNTGIYSPGADQVAISTNGTGRLFVDASGRVGIGVSSPLGSFHVASTAPTILVNNTAAGTDEKFWRIRADGSILKFEGVNDAFSGTNAWLNATRSAGARTIDNIAFFTGTSERMRLDSSGRLGLGTSSPLTTLHVAGAGLLSANQYLGSNLYFDGAAWRYAANGYGGFIKPADAAGYMAFVLGDANNAGGAGAAATINTRMVITPAGNVGIGTTSPGASLDVNGKLRLSSIEDNQLEWVSGAQTWRSNVVSGGKWYLYDVTNAKFPLDVSANSTCKLDINTSHVAFTTSSSERARIDSSGRLLVGTSSAIAVGGATSGFQVAAVAGFIDSQRFSADAFAPAFKFVKSRSATVGTNTIVQSGDELGQVLFHGADGSAYVVAASINGVVDGTPGANDMPGRLVFSTTADGASSPTERMRINNAGNIITTGTFVDPAITGTILEDVFTITDGAAFEVDPGNGSVQLITLGANRTPKATNFAAGESITLMVDDGSAYALTWTDATWGSGGVIWTGGSAPTLATSGYTVLQFWKVSTQVYGALVGEVA
jgi:hypothetical protein